MALVSRPRTSVAAIATALTLLVSSSISRADNWAQYGHDNGNSFASGETWLSRRNVARLQESWTALAGNSATSTPCVVGDTAFIELYVGGIKAISVTDGHTFWSNPVRAPMYGSMSYLSGRLYFADMNSRAYCLVARTGKTVWSVSLGDSTIEGCYGSPVIGNGRMYLGIANKTDDLPCNQGRVSAVNIADGTIAWTWYTVSDPVGGGGVWNSVAYEDASKRVFVATGNACNNDYSDNADCIVALDAETGVLVWKYLAVRRDTKDYDFGSAPALFTAGERPAVAAGCKSGSVYACDRATGELLWKTFVAPQYEYPFVTSTAVGTDRLVVGVGGAGSGPNVPGSVVALKASTGQILWSHSVKGGVYGTPCIVNGVVFSTNGIDSLLALDLQTGEQLWGVPLGSALNYSAPCVASGKVFITGYTMGVKAYAMPALAPTAVVAPSHGGGSDVLNATVRGGVVRFRAADAAAGPVEVFDVRGDRVARLALSHGEAVWTSAARAPRGTYWAQLGAHTTRIFLSGSR